MRELLKRFKSNERGNIAIIFGFAVIPFMIAAGMSVDYGRAVVAKHRLQHAIDTAVLAAGSTAGLSDTARKELGKAFFEANYPPSEYGLNVGSDFITINNNVVSADESTAVNTTLMKLASVYNPLEEMGIQAEAEATIPVTANAEVALVLDYSGSMDWADPSGGGSKYEAMNTAAVDLINNLTSNGAHTRVKFALAPFASQMYGTFPMSGIRTDMRGTQSNSSSSASWTGCFGDREYPYNIGDSAPDSSVVGSGFGERTASNDDRTSYYSCSSTYSDRPFVRLSTSYSTLKTQINGMTASGGTNISSALALGWQLLSPNAPFADGVAYNHNDTAAEDDKVVKVLVLLTDGEHTVKAEGATAYIPETCSNVTFWSWRRGRYVTRERCTGGYTPPNYETSNGNPNIASLCDGMKAPDVDIKVITIGYDLSPGSTILSMLESCASSPSSKYFFNVDGTQGSISDAFDAIGAAISDMVYLSR